MPYKRKRRRKTRRKHRRRKKFKKCRRRRCTRKKKKQRFRQKGGAWQTVPGYPEVNGLCWHEHTTNPSTSFRYEGIYGARGDFGTRYKCVWCGNVWREGDEEQNQCAGGNCGPQGYRDPTGEECNRACGMMAGDIRAPDGTHVYNPRPDFRDYCNTNMVETLWDGTKCNYRDADGNELPKEAPVWFFGSGGDQCTILG